MMCYIDGETLALFTENTWIRDSGASCHIINMIPVPSKSPNPQVNPKQLSQYSGYKKGKLHVKFHPVDGSEWVYTL